MVNTLKMASAWQDYFACLYMQMHLLQDREISQRASNAENVSMSWCHHGTSFVEHRAQFSVICGAVRFITKIRHTCPMHLLGQANLTRGYQGLILMIYVWRFNGNVLNSASLPTFSFFFTIKWTTRVEVKETIVLKQARNIIINVPNSIIYRMLLQPQVSICVSIAFNFSPTAAASHLGFEEVMELMNDLLELTANPLITSKWSTHIVNKEVYCDVSYENILNNTRVN